MNKLFFSLDFMSDPTVKLKGSTCHLPGSERAAADISKCCCQVSCAKREESSSKVSFQLCHARIAQARATSVQTTECELGSSPAVPLLPVVQTMVGQVVLQRIWPSVINRTHCTPGSPRTKFCPEIY